MKKFNFSNIMYTLQKPMNDLFVWPNQFRFMHEFSCQKRTVWCFFLISFFRNFTAYLVTLHLSIRPYNIEAIKIQKKNSRGLGLVKLYSHLKYFMEELLRRWWSFFCFQVRSFISFRKKRNVAEKDACSVRYHKKEKHFLHIE